MEAQETNASKLSLLQRHREARELLVKIRQETNSDCERRVRPQSASCAGAFGKSAEASSSFRPRSAAPSTAHASEAATAAAVHFRPVPNPSWAPTPSAPSAPRKRPLSALPSRVTTSHVGRNRPASACAGERFVEAAWVKATRDQHGTFLKRNSIALCVTRNEALVGNIPYSSCNHYHHCPCPLLGIQHSQQLSTNINHS